MVCSHVTLEVDRGMSWDQAVSRLDSNPGDLNGFYVSRREAPVGRHWFMLATLKDASTHVFRIARFVNISIITIHIAIIVLSVSVCLSVCHTHGLC